MLSFYKRASVSFIILLLFSLLLGYIGIQRTFLEHQLLPAEQSVLPWRAMTVTDVIENGASSISTNDSNFSLDFDFNLKKVFEHPYVSFSLDFKREETPLFIDLSSYSELSFSIKCSPHNVLSFALYVYDEKLSKKSGHARYRLPSTFFSCDKEWAKVNLDLTRLEIPDWWLWQNGLELSDQTYTLEEVSQITFGSSSQSLHDMDSSVKIDGLTLLGRDMRYMYSVSTFLLILWCGFLFWFFKWHTKALIQDIKEKLQKDRPLVAYQQLSVEPQRDKEKSSILSFMATEYANGELNLELAVNKLGISRTKINEILKDELGLTFTSYLNKLRLTEAARLLSEKKEANIAEIAYSVGYRNVPYFNRLFKNEYNCTPKTFKNIYKE